MKNRKIFQKMKHEQNEKIYHFFQLNRVTQTISLTLNNFKRNQHYRVSPLISMQHYKNIYTYSNIFCLTDWTATNVQQLALVFLSHCNTVDIVKHICTVRYIYNKHPPPPRSLYGERKVPVARQRWPEIGHSKQRHHCTTTLVTGCMWL